MITLDVNGTARILDVTPDTPLLWTLRDVLGMTGTKFGCGQALCGACTIHIDGPRLRLHGLRPPLMPLRASETRGSASHRF